MSTATCEKRVTFSGLYANRLKFRRKEGRKCQLRRCERFGGGVASFGGTSNPEKHPQQNYWEKGMGASEE